MIQHKNIIIVFLFLLVFACNCDRKSEVVKDNYVEFSIIKSDDLDSILPFYVLSPKLSEMEYGDSNAVRARDTFYNCYYLRYDDLLILDFGSSVDMKNEFKIYIVKNKAYITYKVPLLREEYFRKPFDPLQSLDTFSLTIDSTLLSDGKITACINMKYYLEAILHGDIYPSYVIYKSCFELKERNEVN